MKKLLSLGLAALMIGSLMTGAVLTSFAEEGDAVAVEPTYVYDFSAYCAAENYGFSSLSDLTIEGGTQGYYTFTATEDGVATNMDPQVYLPAPDVSADMLACAVILYRTESNVRGEIFVDRTDDVIMGQMGSHAYWQYEDDGEWHLELVDASAIWGNTMDVTLRRFRLDPLSLCEEGDSVDISYIKFFASVEDATAYVAANAELRGDFGTTEQVVEKDGKMYGYGNKIAVEYSHETTISVEVDYDLGSASDSFTLNENFLLRDVEDVDAVYKNGQVIAWKAGGYANANHPMYALYGQDGNYVLFESLPFADYDRVTVILCSSGEAKTPWVVGFVSDVEELYGTDVEDLNETAAIVYGLAPSAEEGQVNVSGLGTGVSWNTAERAVTMNIEGTSWDGPAALYVGSHGGHIAVVVKMVFERDVPADVYVDADGSEYVDGQTVIREEDGVFYAYTDLFDVAATEVDGETVYEYDFRTYFGQAPEVPAAPTHTVTFVDEKGNVVATFTFTEGSTEVDWTAPEVPAKEGYVGSWHVYTLGGNEDITVKPRYSLAPSSSEDEDDKTESNTEADTDGSTADTVGGTEETAPATDDSAVAGCKAALGGALALTLATVALGGVVVAKKKD